MDYKVLITTSGLGQRLGELTKYTNKSLVRVGKKPALSYIIESYPKNIPIVMTVGVFGEQVKDFVGLAYPDRTFEFVDDQYDPELSSLGYSMLKARENLQCPFIYHACDTIVRENIPAPDNDWIGGGEGGDVSQYASFCVAGNRISSFADKGADDFDYIHVGLVGVKDHERFWKTLAELHKNDVHNKALGDFPVFVKMLAGGAAFNFVHFPSWLDIGNMGALKKARERIGDHFDNLDKVDESIFIFDDFVIKFFYNEKHVADRVARAKSLDGLAPEIIAHNKNFYKYKFLLGDTYSHVATPANFGGFLNWAKENLWREVNEVSDKEFKDICHDFYYTKTCERVEKFLSANSITDKEDIINGEIVPAVKDILKDIDFDWLTDAKQHKFHGDMVLENIVHSAGSFSLLDWRQNFGGLLEAGDMYYDLAKANHNLVVNHDVVNKNLFNIDFSENGEIKCDIMRRENMVACQKILDEFVRKEGFDADKVSVLTSLIWLNMSPLHHHPFNMFLYYFGKLNLWRAVKSLKRKTIKNTSSVV